MRQPLFLLVMSLLLATLALGRPTVSAPLEYDNDTDGHLSNGGFEGNFYPVGAGQVAEGWTRVNLQGNPNWMSTQVFAGGGWVEKIGGVNSQILSVENLGVGQPFETVLYQQVEGLTPGQSYSFSGWVLKMWGGSANTQLPEDRFSYGSWIGVDPTGGTDPNADTVLWGEQEWQDEVKGHFENHSLAVTATGSRMTVFVRLWLKWQRAETQAIVDALELYEAPQATLDTSSGFVTSPTPRLEWHGSLPESLRQRGNYHLFYQVQQRQADGSWLTIAKDLQDTSFDLTLEEGQSLALRVLPTSYQPAGQPGVWPPTTHIGLPTEVITLTLDMTGPTTTLEPLPRWSNSTPFTVTWAGDDGGRGISGYDVEYRRVGFSEWSRWLTETPESSALFGQNLIPVPLVGGEEWEISVRAHDRAGNVGSWSGPARTAIVSHLLRGRLLTPAGTPLPGARLAVMPYPFSEPPLVDTVGNYELALGGAQRYTLSFLDAQGVKRLPDTELSLQALSGPRDWYLPPAANALSNGHFEEESGGWGSGWQRVTESASGAYAARLVAGAVLSQTVEVVAGQQLSLLWRAETPSAMVRLTLGDDAWQETWRGSEGAWALLAYPVTVEGPQTLTLEAQGGDLLLDQVVLGTPDAAPNALFLPVAR